MTYQNKITHGARLWVFQNSTSGWTINQQQQQTGVWQKTTSSRWWCRGLFVFILCGVGLPLLVWEVHRDLGGGTWGGQGLGTGGSSTVDLSKRYLMDFVSVVFNSGLFGQETIYLAQDFSNLKFWWREFPSVLPLNSQFLTGCPHIFCIFKIEMKISHKNSVGKALVTFVVGSKW